MKKYWSLLLLLFLASDFAVACKCASPESFDIVFTAKVQGIETNKNDNFSQKITFKEISYIKGNKLPDNTIYTPNTLMCGQLFKIGHSYKVYVINDPIPHTKYCYSNTES